MRNVEKLELNGEIFEIGDLVIGEGNVHGSGMLLGKVKELTNISQDDIGIDYLVPEEEDTHFMWLQNETVKHVELITNQEDLKTGDKIFVHGFIDCFSSLGENQIFTWDSNGYAKTEKHIAHNREGVYVAEYEIKLDKKIYKIVEKPADEFDLEFTDEERKSEIYEQIGRYTMRLDELNELIRIKHEAINELEAAIREGVNEKREINEKLEDLKGELN